jgi:hypothetical protein
VLIAVGSERVARRWRATTARQLLDHPDDPTGPFWIRPDRRGMQCEQARSVWSRAGLEVALGNRPLEEGVETSVAVVGGGRLPASKLVGDEVLDVLAS